MTEEIKPLEEVDPELGKYLQDIANGKMNAIVSGSKVYEKIPGGGFKEIKLDIGRNDKCLCGSGKKFKKCCMKEIK